MRRAALLLLLALTGACASAAGKPAAAPASPPGAPYDAAPGAAHVIDVQIDVRAAREILESLSRSQFDPQDAKLLAELPAVRLVVQDSGRAPDVFEHDFAAAFDEKSRASVFDFHTVRKERVRWGVLLEAVASREKDLVRLATRRAAALLPGDRAVSARVRVYFTFGLAGLADHLVLTGTGGHDILIVDLARALGEASGEPLESQISRLARLVAGEAFRQAWAIYRRDSPAWSVRPETAPIDLLLNSVAAAGPAAIFAVDENFFPLSVWLKEPMKRTIDELDRRAERFARAQESLEMRMELTAELKRPEFGSQLAGPSGAYLVDAIVQGFGLDALRSALQNGPKAFFRAYEKATQADKSLPVLAHSIVERLK